MDQPVNRPRLDQARAQTADLPDLQIDERLAAPRRPWLRWLVLAIVALAAAGGLFAWWQQPASDPVSYRTAPVERGAMTVAVSATGALQPLIQVDISSELSGVVRTVSVDENDVVKKGDVLAELDTTRTVANVERAQASVEAAQAAVNQAGTTLTESDQSLARSQQLSTRGLAAQQTLDTAQATRDRSKASVAVAQANLAIAQADLKLQRTDLEKSRIYAPIDGIVLTRSVDPGQTVASSLQAPVLFILAADLKSMELKAAVDEADIGGVKAGQTARFTVDAFPDRRFDARIKDISFASTTTDNVVTYNARLEVENDQLLLRPGMTATVSIVTRQADDVLLVPNAAFRFAPPPVAAGGGWSLQRLFMPPRIGRPDRQRRVVDGMRTLYVLKDGAPQAVQVKPGATDGEKTEIVSGLNEGDAIVLGTREAGRDAR